MSREIRLTPPRDNVFIRLGVDDPQEQALKVDLAVAFMRAMEELGLTPTEAARRIGTQQPRISRLVGGYLDEFSSDTISSYLERLGYTVRVEVDARTAPAD